MRTGQVLRFRDLKITVMKDKGLILLTGATGYIGSHTAVELMNAGYDVVGVDNFYNSNPHVLEGIKKITRKDMKFEETDCSDYKAFEKVFEKYPQIVGAIHFAACKAVGESIDKPLLYYRNNIVSLLNLIDLMNKKAKSANIVFSSSCTVYGQPSKEYLPIPETAPLIKSPSPYGKSKQMAEDILSDSVVAFPNLKVCALRYFNPIGAHPSAFIGELPRGVPQNLIPYITQTAAGIRDHLSVFGDDYNTPDGSCIRDYIYVVDLAKAHVKAVGKLLEDKIADAAAAKASVAANSPYPTAEATGRWTVYNLGTGKGVSVLELVKGFMEATGVDLKYKIVPRRQGDVEQVWADPSKAKRVLGWSADTPLEDVLRSAWKWQQALSGKKN